MTPLIVAALLSPTLAAAAPLPAPAKTLRHTAVAFGSFPSTSLNQKFGLLQPKGRKSRAFVVTAPQMARYFEPLD